MSTTPLSVSPGDLTVAEGQRNGKFSQNGKLGHSCTRVIKTNLVSSRVRDLVEHLGLNVNSSTHNCGCMVNGSCYGSNLIILLLRENTF